MGDRWRDQHRHASGRFLPRPGAKGFREAPKKDAPEEKRPNTLSLWVDKTRRGDR